MAINAVTDAVLTIDKTTQLYDINIDADGDIETADFFDTSILYSLFGERRANENEVLDASRRRGWIGNENKDFENGSKLWLFEQARITATNLARIADEAKKSLQWLVDDGFAVSLQVAEVTVDTKLNKLILVLDIRRSFDVVERKFFELWDNTGKR
jgi:phage gp46-like protein